LDSEFPEFSCLGVVFLFTEFSLHQQIYSLLFFTFKIFCFAHEHILFYFIFKVNILFSDLMKIEELVGSFQTYEHSLPPVRKAKAIALKAAKNKSRVSSYEDSNNEEEDAVAMLSKNVN
jgi:hypothetical protein